MILVDSNPTASSSKKAMCPIKSRNTKNIVPMGLKKSVMFITKNEKSKLKKMQQRLKKIGKVIIDDEVPIFKVSLKKELCCQIVNYSMIQIVSEK